MTATTSAGPASTPAHSGDTTTHGGKPATKNRRMFEIRGPAGERLRLLRSEKNAHHIAHLILAGQPDRSPLTVSNRADGTGKRVEADHCDYEHCDVREIAEAEAEYARGEFTTGEEARARYGLPPADTPRTTHQPPEDPSPRWPVPTTSTRQTPTMPSTATRATNESDSWTPRRHNA